MTCDLNQQLRALHQWQQQILMAMLQAPAQQYFSAANVFGPHLAVPPKIEDAGITAGEIIAHRIWRVRKGFLFSTYMHHAWAPGEPTTGDVSYFGVHAWKTASEAIAYVGYNSHQLYVLGRVALWGEVVEHERGYRAEFAKIIAIDDLITDGRRWGRRRMLAELRERYGVA